jgi:hypothetical protein
MKVSEKEYLRLQLATQHLHMCRTRGTTSRPKVTLMQAFWCVYPLAFFYAWKGVLW